MVNVLIYGFTNKGNTGDELFVEAYKKLFPEYNLIFTDFFTKARIDNADAIFIGGGSFLFSDLGLTPTTFKLLKNKKIFYLGVGAETDISMNNQELMKIAQLIAVRSSRNLELLRSLNPNVIVIPDLAYCLKELAVVSPKIEKSVLVLPNFVLVPQNSDPHWKYASWEYFKSEFSQFLDYIIDDGYSVSFLPMSHNKVINDNAAGVEIHNKMKNRHAIEFLKYSPDFSDITKIMSSYSLVITQRFHGIVLADLLGIPHINIHHHDKLKYAEPANGGAISYYGITKAQLKETFFTCLEKKQPEIIIDLHTFEAVCAKVRSIISG